MELLFADDLVLIAETARGTATGKVEEIDKGDGNEGSESECW